MSESNANSNKKVAGATQDKKNKIESAVKKNSVKKPPAKPAQEKSTKQAKQPASRMIAVLLLVVFLLTAGGAGGGYFIWQKLQSSAAQQDAQRQLISEDVSMLRNSMMQMNDAMKTTLSDQRSEIMNRLQQEFQLFRDELSSMRPNVQQTQKPDWVIAEVDYLIRVANHRLQLEQDVDMGIMALLLADERLRTLSNPEALLVRRQLKNEITELKLLSRLDIEGMSLTLSSLQKQIESLPVNGYEELLVSKAENGINFEPASGWKEFFTDVWGSLKGLVSIRRIDDTERALITPDQKIYILQNLSLKIEAARYALLKNDNALFHTSLKTVDDWLVRYFDNDSAALFSIKETLDEFDSVVLNKPLPIIKESMIALQALRKNVQLKQAAAGDSSSQ